MGLIMAMPSCQWRHREGMEHLRDKAQLLGSIPRGACVIDEYFRAGTVHHAIYEGQSISGVMWDLGGGGITQYPRLHCFLPLSLGDTRESVELRYLYGLCLPCGAD